MKKWTIDGAALLLRVAAGLIFIPHGFSKVFGTGGPAASAHDMPSFGIPALLGYVAAYSELFGAILLIGGLLTRLDALLLTCTMVVAVFVVQLPDALKDPEAGGGNRLFAALHGIELPLALLAITGGILLIGPGRFSLDSLLRTEERVRARWARKPTGSAMQTTARSGAVLDTRPPSPYDARRLGNASSGAAVSQIPTRGRSSVG